MKRKKTRKKRRTARSKHKDGSPLVKLYIERRARAYFDLLQDDMERRFRGKPVIYALYKDDELYYVGLSGGGHGRIDDHQRDRHRKRWNRFSAWILRSQRYLDDIETLLLRVGRKPKGNRNLGGFARARNMKRDFEARLRERKKEIDAAF